ncbi:hypothetical protein ACFFRR_006564 [Megaselia abdita]
MGIFIDIEGAFDNATSDGMCNALRTHGVDEVLITWIKSMRESRSRLILSKLVLFSESHNSLTMHDILLSEEIVTIGNLNAKFLIQKINHNEMASIINKSDKVTKSIISPQTSSMHSFKLADCFYSGSLKTFSALL